MDCGTRGPILIDGDDPMPTENPSDARDPRGSQPRPPFPQQHQEGTGREALLRPSPRFEALAYRPAGKLDGRSALITGGDSGIGRAVAVIFAREGADIALAYLPHEQEDAEVTQRHVRQAGRRCELMPGDLRDRRYCDELVERTVAAFGRLDVLVSNAAHQNRKPSIADIDDETFERTFDINVFACFRLCRKATEVMDPGASIIVTTSETGLLGSKQLLDYSATKGALNAFVKALAQNVLERGIRVNAVAPGPVWTPLNPADSGMSPERVANFGAHTPMGRAAQPEELAPAYVYLASGADSAFLTGVVLPVMGGETVSG